MDFKYPLGFVVLFFIFLGGFAQAQVYEPGTGILLPKRQQDKKDEKDSSKRRQPVKILNNGNADTAVVKKGSITTPSQPGPLIVQPGRTNGQSNNDQQLTEAYAAHVYTSVCSQDYRDSLAAFTEKGLDRRKMWADIQVSCKCLTKEVMSVVAATDLTDYVMFTRAAQNGSQLAPEVASYYSSGQSSRIQQLVSNEQIRKKCGFLN